MTIEFVIVGHPEPGGSKRPFLIKRKDGTPVTTATGVPVIATVDANPKAKGWKNQVAWEARRAYTGPLLNGPLEVRLYFFRPRPKNHFGKAGLNKTGRDALAPITKPDVLKLARSVEDALTQVIWRDDAQIVVETLSKGWGEPARCEVVIREIEP